MKYREEANKKFDSKVNWSTMIAPDNNKIRNEVMKKNLYEQLKRNMMSDFLRKARNDIIAKRPKQEVEAPPATLSTTLQSQLAQPKGSKSKKEEIQSMAKSKSNTNTRMVPTAAEKQNERKVE